MVLPSVNDSTETSGPVRNSSMTMRLPLSPKILSSIIDLTADFASSIVSAITTPLPSASPSALITAGIAAVSRYERALSISSNTSYSAVGILYFFISSFANTLLLSITAAALSGPKHLIPMASSASTAPRASGSSGATTAKSILFAAANSVIFSMSFAPMSMHSASFAMPPFPGSAYIVSAFLFSLSFLIIACSRPPPPTTSIFISITC